MRRLVACQGVFARFLGELLRRLAYRFSVALAAVAVSIGMVTPVADATTQQSGARLIATVPLSAASAALSPSELARRVGTTSGSSRAVTTMPRREAKTPAQLAEIAKPSGYTYKVDSRQFATTGVKSAASPAVVDIVTPDECTQKYLDGFSGDYWFKNRFAACRSMILLGDYEGCTDGECRIIGYWKIELAYVFNMADNDRATEVQIKMSNMRTDPDVPDTAALNFSVGCWDPGPSGPNCDPVTTSLDHTIGEWNSIGLQSSVIRFAGESQPLPDDPALNEHRSYYDLMPYFYLGNGNGGQAFVQAPTANTRCDIARTVVNPQYVRTSDCVFHKVTGVFSMSASDPEVAESARFIRDAQTNITSTYPGTPGSYVPGVPGTPTPLTRLFYDDAMRNANRATSIEACVAGFGKDYTVRPDPNEKNDCDEYPFATTNEGSYEVKQKLTLGSYAVRPLLSTHNQNAGNRLGQWVAEAHVLELDPYYVEITD